MNPDICTVTITVVVKSGPNAVYGYIAFVSNTGGRAKAVFICQLLPALREGGGVEVLFYSFESYVLA